MASLIPARAMGFANRLGSLSAGKDASLTALDEDGNVRLTLVAARWFTPTYKPLHPGWLRGRQRQPLVVRGLGMKIVTKACFRQYSTASRIRMQVSVGHHSLAIFRCGPGSLDGPFSGWIRESAWSFDPFTFLQVVVAQAFRVALVVDQSPPASEDFKSRLPACPGSHACDLDHPTCPAGEFKRAESPIVDIHHLSLISPFGGKSLSDVGASLGSHGP